MLIKDIEIGKRMRHDMGDLAPLMESMSAIGQLQPVVIDDHSRLIAGARRIAAAKALGWDSIEVVTAVTVDDVHKHLIAERDENTCRLDFAPSEAVAMAEALQPYELKEAERREREHAGRPKKGAEVAPISGKGKSRDKVADSVGMGRTALKQATEVVRLAAESPDLFADLVVKMDETGKVAAAHAEMKKRIKKQNRDSARGNIPNAPDAPTGKPGLVYSDPPWRYDFAETDNRKVENQYPTASVEEIISHAPEVDTDCVLLLWATAPKLREALRVLHEWGFEYKTCAVWDKEKIGTGYWFRGQHELLLVGTRGGAKPPEQDSRVSSVFKEKRTEHSKKPECVYEWIESAFPNRVKLEMYCRFRRPGWQAWGNEI